MDRRLGSGPPWYCHDWELDFVEAVGTVMFLLTALCFEKVYHHIQHNCEHSFVYGQSMLSEEEKHKAVERSSFAKPLRLIWFQRLGGEFMVLGFLAFLIWCCNQQGIMDAFAEITASDMNLPTVGSDYLHLMEAVHMQLFVAMILYFALGIKIVISSDNRIKEFEHNRGVWIEQIMSKTDKNFDTDTRSLLEFKKWRGHFLHGRYGCVREILAWRENEPKTFTKIMGALNINKPEDEITVEDIQKVCTGRFSFCTYLVFSVCSAAQEVVNVSEAAILTIVLLKVFLAILHRGAKVDSATVSTFFSALCFLFIVLTWTITLVFRKALAESEEDIKVMKGVSWLPYVMDKISHKVNPEAFVLNTLQVLLFFFCHTWSGNMIDKNFWNKIFQDGKAGPIGIAILYCVGFIALAQVLPRAVPDFAAVTALPPFFSNSNERIVQMVAVQVVDQKMVAARAQMAQQEKQNENKRPSQAVKEEKDGGQQSEDKQAQEPKDPAEIKSSSAMPPKDQQENTEDPPPSPSKGEKPNVPLLKLPTNNDLEKIDSNIQPTASENPDANVGSKSTTKPKKGKKTAPKTKGSAEPAPLPIGKNQE